MAWMETGLAAMVAMAVGLASSGWAMESDTMLFVSPVRVLITSGTDTEVISVTNKSTKPHKYVISLTDQAMQPNGATLAVDTFAYSAKKMVRFMPRRIDLAAGQRQLVRLMVVRPVGLPDGDYHTHILFDEDVVPASATETSGTLPLTRSLKVELATRYSVAIPVVVQQGDVSGSLTLGELHMGTGDKGRPELQLDVARHGNGEADGYLVATIDGKPVIAPRRLRIYHEIDQARVPMPLTVPLDKSLSGKTITVSLLSGPEEKARLMGSASLKLP